MAGLFSSILIETYNKYRDIFSYIRYVSLSDRMSTHFKSISIKCDNINYYLLMDAYELKSFYSEYAKYNSESDRDFDHKMFILHEFVNKYTKKEYKRLVIPLYFIDLNNYTFTEIAIHKYMR